MSSFNLNKSYIYLSGKQRGKLIIVDFYGKFENKIIGACDSAINTNYV